MANNVDFKDATGLTKTMKTTENNVSGVFVHTPHGNIDTLPPIKNDSPAATVGAITTAITTVALSIDDYAGVGVAIFGSYAGVNIAFEISFDGGTTWVGTQAVRTDSSIVESSSGVLGSTSRAWDIYCGAATNFRVRATAWTSGSASIVIIPQAIYEDTIVCATIQGTVTVDTELPAAAALADGAANPTAPTVGAAAEDFNGTTWDRHRNNFNVNTGDTGAKTTNFSSATQTNYNAKGAIIAFNIGAVSGTTPTLVAKLQGSSDGGTTWYDIPGAATAPITATGVVVLAIYPGATPAANAAVSYPLPRTWRVAYTIGGTTPSFTITNVQVAYIV
jgi:hypothetical protein